MTSEEHKYLIRLYDPDKKMIYSNAYYSVDIDKNQIICENGEDLSGHLMNIEMLLALGIDRKDVVFLDQNGRWIKRRFDYSTILDSRALIWEDLYCPYGYISN